MATQQLAAPVSVRHILVPVDFSERSETAINFATAIARNLGSQITLAHVISHSNSLGDARAHLNRLVDTTHFGSIEHDEVVLRGEIDDQIARAVEQRDIDLIVIATQGHEGLQKIILGSTSEQIFRRVSCPVLIVGPQVPRRAPWEVKTINEILCPVDFHVESVLAAEHAVHLCGAYRSHLTLASVLPETVRTGPQIAGQVEHERERLRAVVAQNCHLPCNPTLEVLIGDPAAEVVKYSRENRSELIVLGVRERAFLGSHALSSFATEVAAQARCPVLTIHPHTRSY